jgi:hypothetical protein
MRMQIDGREYVFDLKKTSSRLLHASAEQRAKYEVSPSGYGIHWPLIDEDLSVDGLLGISHVQPQKPREPRRGSLVDRQEFSVLHADPGQIGQANWGRVGYRLNRSRNAAASNGALTREVQQGRGHASLPITSKSQK